MKNTYAHINLSAKKLNKLAFCLILMLSISNKTAAQQFNNWYFPAFSGVTFNTNPPTFLPNGQINSNGCSAISDINGNLLFYTNGTDVWNKNHQKMPNGFGLLGGGGTSNNVFILPFANGNKYYIFTSGGLFFVMLNSVGYNYSIVDMSLQNGLGDVSIKNVFLNGPSSEKLLAVPHPNGSDIWLVTKNFTNQFLSYKISCSGVNPNPVISYTGLSFLSNINLAFGQSKVSPSSKYIVAASFYGSFIQLYKFNNTFGTLDSSLVIPTPNKFPFGIEFSSDSKKLYVCCNVGNNQNKMELFQFDLNQYDSAIISSSMVKVGEKNNVLHGCLQLASDSKIYHVGFNDSSLNVINTPNLTGLNCNFQTNQIYLQATATGGILPYVPSFLFTAQNVQIPSYTVASDCRTVTLTGKTYIKGLNLTFKWKFGDGDSTVQTVASGGDTTFSTVTHFYPLGVDTFTVQLFVTSDTVCGQGSAGKKVVVKPPKPTAKFGFVASCNSAVVSFKDSSLLNFNPSITYQWRFFNKQNVLLGSSNLQNPVYTFPTLDTFFAQLIVRSSLACVQADTLLKAIVLKAKPVAGFSYTNACGSLAASFTNTSFIATDSLQGFTWLLGDGNSSSLKNPTNTYTSYGSYTVKLVVSSAQGCVSDTFSLPVLIKAKPVANFIYSNNGCAGLPVLLQDSSYVTNSTISGHYWLLPNGNSYTTTQINPVFAVGNSYAIKYMVSSSLGCVSDTLVKSVLIESIPIAAINPATIGGCVNQALALQDASTIAVGQITAWAWQVGSQTSAAQNPSFSFSTASNYTAQLVVSSKHGCVSNTASQPLSIESQPVAAFTNGLVCLEKPVTFTNSSLPTVGAISQTAWLLNNSLVSNSNSGFTYTFNQGGSYTVGLVVSTANGCTDMTEKTLMVDPAPIYAGRDTVVRQGEPFVLQGSGGLRYVWQPAVGLDDPNKQYPIGILNQSQQYSLMVTTAQGCVGYDTVLVTVLKGIRIPNAFSPNGDGVHDVWEIEGLDAYPNAQVSVYNRQGMLVYAQKNIGSRIAWTGISQNQGQALPVGTYYYIIRLGSPLYPQNYAGWVMLLR